MNDDFIQRMEQLKNDGLRQHEERIAKGHLASFEQLQSIHSYATNIWAMPVLGKNDEVWGVLVVDSLRAENPFTQTALQNLENSTLAIGTILKATA